MSISSKRYRIIYASFIVLFSYSILIYSPLVISQDNSLTIDVSSNVVSSTQNFTVSVYDPSIEHGTPYLVNVTILFNQQYYQITPNNENSELTLTAPIVFVNKTYLIEAFTKNKTGNTTIQIIPQQHVQDSELVITIDTYTIKADQEFTVLITDRNGSPIENAMIGFLENGNIKTPLLTNEEGKASLLPPNKETIVIIAQKLGYISATETRTVQLKQDIYSTFLSDPMLPIYLSIFILICVILYISGIKSYRKVKQERIRIKNQEDKLQCQLTNPSKKELYTQKTPNNNNKPLKKRNPSKTKTQPILQKDTSNKPSVEWFKPTVQQKQAHQSNASVKKQKNTWHQGTDEFHKKIDNMLAKKEKEKKVKSS